ncbi:MAG: HAD family hydrolase [Candidatus Fimivivens sp.]
MKAAIFDMDGTLLDSLGMWYGFAPAFCKEHGIVWTQPLADDLLGLAFPEAAEVFTRKFPQLNMSANELISTWINMVHFSYAHEVTLKPFAIDYIKKLNQCNIPCAVATMTNHALADAALAHHGITTLVQTILTPEDVGGVGKERPDIYIEAAQRLGVPVEQCVVFEDTLFAIKTAAKAGFTVWAIDEPLQEAQHEIKSTCHRYIHSFEELLNDRSK